MASQPVTFELGAFAAGEVPPALEISFTDWNGQPVDLSGFATVQCNIDEELDSAANPLGTGNIIVVGDGTGGVVKYTWVRDDMLTPGEYTLQAWTSNGVNYFASDLYLYSVYDGPGDPPA